MEATDLRRLIVRHRHVAPMLSALLAGTDARVRITDLDGDVILDRQSGAGAADAGGADAPGDRHPIRVDGSMVGWVEGPKPAGAIAAVIAYAAAREADKRALAHEALDRYRELNLIYDLAERLGGMTDVDAVAGIALAEVGRLPSGGEGFLIRRDGPDRDRIAGGLLGAILEGDPDIVNDVRADPRAIESELAAMASLVAAPLRVRGERIGLIGSASAEPREYRAVDLKVLTAIAALTAPAIAQASAREAVLREG
jgi:GAF domain